MGFRFIRESFTPTGFSIVKPNNITLGHDHITRVRRRGVQGSFRSGGSCSSRTFQLKVAGDYEHATFGAPHSVGSSTQKTRSLAMYKKNSKKLQTTPKPTNAF